MKKFIILLILSIYSLSFADLLQHKHLSIIAIDNAVGDCAGGSDGLIGSSNITSDDFQSGATLLRWTYFTPSGDGGTVTYAHGAKDGTGNYRIGIWSQDGSTLHASTALTAGGGDASVARVDAALDSSFCLVNGTTYIVGIWLEDGFKRVGTSGYSGGNNFYYQTVTPFGTFTPSTANTVSDRLLGVQLNNTAGGFE